MTDQEWRDQLSIGDEVFVSQPYGRPPAAAEVSRFTKTQIFIRKNGDSPGFERAYRKKDGWLVGGDSWGTSSLIQPTEKVREQIEISMLKGVAANLRSKLAIPQEKQELLALIAALGRFVKK